MFKIFITLLALLLIIAGYIAHPILAGGDQVRGEEGEGLTTQTCITPDYDGIGCPYGEYTPPTE